MNVPGINEMLLGAISMGSLVVAMFFWRFWQSTRDRFFLMFALSFLIEAVNRLAMVLMHSWNEAAPSHYLVRLVSYGLILWAIWSKNRGQK